jgi:hypothetical protein
MNWLFFCIKFIRFLKQLEKTNEMIFFIKNICVIIVVLCQLLEVYVWKIN